jgi:hypothetical protein
MKKLETWNNLSKRNTFLLIRKKIMMKMKEQFLKVNEKIRNMEK